MSITGLLSLFLVAGIAGGAYFYRDDIRNGITGLRKSEEEQAIDLQEKQRQLDRARDADDAFDSFFENLGNFFSGKDNSKQVTKSQVATDEQKDILGFNQDALVIIGNDGTIESNQSPTFDLTDAEKATIRGIRNDTRTNRGRFGV